MQRPPSILPPQALASLKAIPIDEASHARVAIKRIQSDADVHTWKESSAYANLVLFVSRLCESAVGKATKMIAEDTGGDSGSNQSTNDAVGRVWSLLDTLQQWTKEIEPLKTPQRFGNLAFRTWGKRLEETCDELHKALLPAALHGFINELREYLVGGFGSWVRLDYGSGHELSFVAWLSILQRIGFLAEDAQVESSQITLPTPTEEQLALRVFPKYLQVVWGLQDRYGLEPAGSHGVWGLDDYQFIPYAIGAAQLRQQSDYPPIAVASASHKPDPSPMPPRDLLNFVPPSSPLADASAGRGATSRLVSSTTLPGPPFANLYTSSIARIHSLKRGPFHEHSPILHDVATTVPNWVKVHGGMMKMWQAECLDKRPVVQHFPFGGVAFVWPSNTAAVQQHADLDTGTRTPSLVAAPMAPTAAPWTSQSSATRLPSDHRSTHGPTSTAVPWTTAAARFAPSRPVHVGQTMPFGGGLSRPGADRLANKPPKE